MQETTGHQGADLEIREHMVPTEDGWQLHAKRVRSSAHFDPALRPMMIVPGYAMNAFIFGFHPRGTSMERFFAESGREVWSVNLRRQGPSKPTRRSAPAPSMENYARIDLPTLIHFVLGQPDRDADAVDVVGASLGGSIIYGHLATADAQQRARVGGVVAIGSPLRWEGMNRALKLAFRSPRLARRLRLSGTRRLARFAFPVLTRVPRLLSLYMNTAHVDLSASRQLTRTIEDPQPEVNGEIAEWIQAADLTIAGVNVTRGVGNIENPLLLVVANRDGIVPTPAALSARAAWGREDVEVLHIGDDRDWFAHADLFIADDAAERVFRPIARWLDRIG